MIIKIQVECIPDQGEREGLNITAETADPGETLGEKGIIDLIARTLVAPREHLVPVENDLVLRLVEEIL